MNAHTHLVKGQVLPRGSVGNAPKGERVGLNREVKDQLIWATVEGDMDRRIDFGLREAYHFGLRAVRTHLDGVTGPNEVLLRGGGTAVRLVEVCSHRVEEM